MGRWCVDCNFRPPDSTRPDPARSYAVEQLLKRLISALCLSSDRFGSVEQLPCCPVMGPGFAFATIAASTLPRGCPTRKRHSIDVYTMFGDIGRRYFIQLKRIISSSSSVVLNMDTSEVA
eukprot:s2806_g12.t1